MSTQTAVQAPHTLLVPSPLLVSVSENIDSLALLYFFYVFIPRLISINPFLGIKFIFDLAYFFMHPFLNIPERNY
jgi:hypothetical protein